MAQTIQEENTVQKLALNTHIKIRAQTPVWCDSQAAIQMMETREGKKRRKLIDLNHIYIKKIVAKCDFILDHFPTGNQKVDIFSKTLSRVEFEIQNSVLGVHKLDPLETRACETRKRLPDQEGPELDLKT